MAKVRPFRPLRYVTDPLQAGSSSELGRRIAPPYDVIDASLRAELAARDAHNVVRLDLPEGDGDAKYEVAARLLGSWLESGVLARDQEPAFFTYSQRFVNPVDGGTRTRRGFFAAVQLEPYDARVILPHERTLSGPKEDRRKLLEATRTALSPGFLLFRGRGELAQLATAEEVLAEFETADGVVHRLGRVVDAAVQKAVSDSFADAQLLIADGHHRYETALRYAGLRAEEPTAASRHGLFFLVDEDDPELLVLPTHRIVHSLPDFDEAAFLQKLEQLFTVRSIEPVGVLAELAAVGNVPSFAIRTKGSFVLASLRDASARPLDVVVLHELVIEQLLGVSREAQAAKTNIRYVQDANAAIAQTVNAESGAQITFLLNSTPASDVRRIASAGDVMPQKSTFFYPKVPTGLLFLPLDGTL